MQPVIGMSSGISNDASWGSVTDGVSLNEILFMHDLPAVLVTVQDRLQVYAVNPS
jgi:hypothetical protein